MRGTAKKFVQQTITSPKKSDFMFSTFETTVYCFFSSQAHTSA